ncbi:MAG: hypothetical protein VKK03_02285 [Synechococcus sp.]|nr:hypothetical protein [Synechococcus sp.]
MRSSQRFELSPLIRFTLLAVYLCLVVPLPALAPSSLQPWLLIAAPLGFILVLALLSEQVNVSSSGLSVGYPSWCNWVLRRGWALNWEEIRGLIPVATSQGGTVYYFKTSHHQHQLLPQRLDRFPEFLSLVQEHSGIDTTRIGRLTPPWTYQLLAGLATLMLLGEALTAAALSQGWLAMPASGPG